MRRRQSHGGPAASRPGSLSRREFLRIAGAGVAASLLAGCGVAARVRRPKLVVWSCGGNYDFLLDVNQRFEALAGCRIIYSSAPVEHLISVLASRPRGVDILVGRSGPGWSDLQQRGRLASKPEVFALDPYVIIVPPGNPGGVRSLVDLKRPGVKTVYSPTASGPSGKVVQCVLEAADRVVEPGIWQGYVRNAIEAHDCGWKVFPPVIEGRADAAVTRLSMTTAPETAGKVEVIRIPVRVMAAMAEGHGAIPQRTAVLADTRDPVLAGSYVEALCGELGRELCGKHGYVHRLAPEAESHRPLFQMRADGSGRGARGQASAAGTAPSGGRRRGREGGR
jgi:molybdate transport system substrate-binding protein